MANPINIKFPLEKGDNDAFKTNDSTIDAVLSDLKILILTNHGERPVHYDFGANLRRLIFEQGPNVAQQAEDLIVAAIEKWMEFVEILEINVQDSNSNPILRSNELNIKLKVAVGQEVAILEQRVRN